MRRAARFILCIFTAIGLTSAATTTSKASGAKHTTAASKIATQTKTLTIAAIGDSLGNGLWEGLHLQLRKNKHIAVVRGAQHSVGFTGSSMLDQIDKAFANGPVDAVVIMIGANDDRRSFFINGKSVALFGTPKWIAHYSKRVEAFMDHAGRHHAPLVWVLLPVMRTPEATRAAKIFNDIVTKAAASRRFVALVPTWSITADKRGAYMAYFEDRHGKKRLMRHSDGLHFTRAGYDLLGRLTMEKLLEVSPRFKSVVSNYVATRGH